MENLPFDVSISDSLLLGAHVASEVATAFAYGLVAIALSYLLVKGRDYGFRSILGLFAALFIAAAVAHLLASWPDPMLIAAGKLATAALACAAAGAVWPILPQVLAMPTRSRLQQEVRKRKASEEALRMANRALELRVRQRTADLERSLDMQRAEVLRRQRAEQAALRAREEALQARDSAVRASAAKARFLAATGHDLRQPLQAVRLYTDYLLEQRDPDKARQAAQRLSEALTSAESLLTALLDISRLEAGLEAPQPRPVLIGDILDRVRLQAISVAAGKGVRLRVVRSSAVVMSEPVHLQRMIRNLLLNAFHHTDRGGVLVGCRRAGGRLSVEVWDTGAGIPPEHQELIFEEFYQIGNDSRNRAGGLGLGLSFVRRAAKALGHEVTVRSWPGKGSVFSISMPLADAAEAAEPILTSRRRGG